MSAATTLLSTTSAFLQKKCSNAAGDGALVIITECSRWQIIQGVYGQEKSSYSNTGATTDATEGFCCNLYTQSRTAECSPGRYENIDSLLLCLSKSHTHTRTSSNYRGRHVDVSERPVIAVASTAVSIA